MYNTNYTQHTILKSVQEFSTETALQIEESVHFTGIKFSHRRWRACAGRASILINVGLRRPDSSCLCSVNALEVT